MQHATTMKRTLHVSDSFSVHHQESSIVDTAMVYAIQVMDTACQQAVTITCMTCTYCCVYSARLVMMDREIVRNM